MKLLQKSKIEFLVNIIWKETDLKKKKKHAVVLVQCTHKSFLFNNFGGQNVLLLKYHT